MGTFEDYSAALVKFAEADEKVTAYSTLLGAISQELGARRSRFSFSNTGAGFPMEVIMSRDSRSIDGNQFPAALEINEALAEWHEAKKKVRDFWFNLSEAQRGALKPPPTAALAP